MASYIASPIELGSRGHELPPGRLEILKRRTRAKFDWDCTYDFYIVALDEEEADYDDDDDDEASN